MKALESKVVDLEGKLSTFRDGFASGNVISSSGSVPPTPVTNSNTNQQRKSGVFHDRKLNLIIRGIPECPQNTKRFKQFELDQHKVLKQLSHLDSSINPSCIKDMFRLGKHNKDSSRPRPILVKLLHSCDVQCILSKRSSLEAPISIKPDMTIEERNNGKILLKQRWLLLQQKLIESRSKFEVVFFS